MAVRKYMTNCEREAKRYLKKQLQKEGILPADKPRLNRKKFAKEVCQEWKNYCLGDPIKLSTFIIVLEMMTNSGTVGKVSQEDLGILKLKKCVIVLEQKLQENDNKLTYEQIVEVLEPIWKL